MANQQVGSVTYGIIPRVVTPYPARPTKEALTSVNDPHNKDEAASSRNPAPGVVITPPVGIQWQKITGDLLPTFK